MNSQIAKKIRQQHRRTQHDVLEGVKQALPQVAARAVLEMRKWPVRHRLKFVWWLLVGRGEWRGV